MLDFLLSTVKILHLNACMMNMSGPKALTGEQIEQVENHPEYSAHA